jgi:putative redox protein
LSPGRTWLRKHVASSEKVTTDHRRDNLEKQMNITVQHIDGMRFLGTADAHTVVVDAAPEDGGSGTSMSAPQFFVAALGACILEFVVNSCRLRGVPVEQAKVEMAYDEVMRPRRLDAVQAALHIEPDPPDDVKRRLLGVARHATLVNTLVRPPQVDIQFAQERGQTHADL